MEALRELLVAGNEGVNLDRAALELAAIEFPDLAIEPYLALLDSYAAELGSRVASDAGAREFVETANQYLFEDLGFHGNERDYYDPHNSCLNEVLTRRTGIPITLSIVYMEVARRLSRPVYGIGLPGHFLVQYDDGLFSAYIDPFHGGRLLAAAECYETARQVTGMDVSGEPAALQPVAKRQILIRMLNNLRGVYLRRRSFQKALAVLDRLIEAAPGSAEDYKQRAVVRLQLRQLRPARSDFETYLRLAPQAPDREEVERQLETLRRWLATLN